MVTQQHLSSCLSQKMTPEEPQEQTYHIGYTSWHDLRMNKHIESVLLVLVQLFLH